MSIPEGLQRLVDDGVVDDVRARLMSGKEASVFIVERAGQLIAAKVYKDRDERTFKSTSSYTEGRNQTRNSRDKRAMGKRTSYGKELIDASWRDMEYRALQDAFHAGVRVPEPYFLYDDVLLMELLVDEAGAPAPRLADVHFTSEVAELLHREIYGQVRLLLSCGKIHGDLSAFNILMTARGPMFIDFPQVVDAAGNNQAAEILRRDLQNITEFFARFDSRLLRFRECGTALWQHYQRGTLHEALDPEVVVPREARGGRRMRDAERGRAGRGDGPRRHPNPSQQQRHQQRQHDAPQHGSQPQRAPQQRHDGAQRPPHERHQAPPQRPPQQRPPQQRPPQQRHDAPHRPPPQRHDAPQRPPPQRPPQRPHPPREDVRRPPRPRDDDDRRR